MPLNHSSKPPKYDGKRYDAVNCVRIWLNRQRDLAKDLTVSLHYLIPELKKELPVDADE
jgi:hypothetical protein